MKKPILCKPFARTRCLVPLVFFGCFMTGAVAQDVQNPCGPLEGVHYGPYDYRTQRARLRIVEVAHFTPVVESLVGSATGDMGKDLAYTLRAAPNHHRALVSIVKWGERRKTKDLPGMEYTIDCWFERALRFAPDDHLTRSLYAQYVGKSGNRELASKQLELILSQTADNPLAIHNVGLIYFELNMFDQALEQAHKSLSMGFVNSRLEAQLRQAGKWQDPKP